MIKINTINKRYFWILKSKDQEGIFKFPVFKIQTLDYSSTRNLIIDPNYISGFTQTDGGFHIEVTLNNEMKLGYRIQLIFNITQHEISKEVLEMIKHFFGKGTLQLDKRNNCWTFFMKGHGNANQIICPHFKNFPIYSAKWVSFFIFMRVLEMINNKEHLTKEGLAKIVILAWNMNTSTTRSVESLNKILKTIGMEDFDGISLINQIRKEAEDCKPVENNLNPWFISGVTDGDGGLLVSITSNQRLKPSFTIIQHNESKSLLEAIKTFFGCGISYTYMDRGSERVRYQVDNLSDLLNIIIPHFDKYPLLTFKKERYVVFKEVVEAMQNKEHVITSRKEELINQIRDLQLDLLDRKKR